MSYFGDIRLGDTIDIKFCTVGSSGAPTQLAGSPVISAYPGNSTTQLTAGITLSVDFDSVTGLNNVRIVASGGNGYATATEYALVITTGTVGGTSVVGYVVGTFSIEKRSALMPTTAGRTLDVSAGGEAGVDWANVGGPTTTVVLSGTTVKTATDVETDTADIQTRIGTPSDLGGGASLSANLVDIESQTDDIGVAGAGLTALATQASVDTIDNFLDTEVADIYSALIKRKGTAQAGAAGSITLDAGAPSTNLIYFADWVLIVSGTGAGQIRLIIGYDGTTKVASIVNAWQINPDNTSVFMIIPAAPIDIGMWRQTVPSSLATGRVQADAVAISGSTSAADAVEANIGNLDTAVSTRATQSSVNTIDGIVDAILALLDDARTEPGQGAPPVNPDLATKIDYLYKAWRNRKTQTATQFSLYADDATTVDQKSTVSDNGTTFDAGEMTTGA